MDETRKVRTTREAVGDLLTAAILLFIGFNVTWVFLQAAIWLYEHVEITIR